MKKDQDTQSDVLKEELASMKKDQDTQFASLKKDQETQFAFMNTKIENFFNVLLSEMKSKTQKNEVSSDPAE